MCESCGCETTQPTPKKQLELLVTATSGGASTGGPVGNSNKLQTQEINPTDPYYP